MDKWLRKQLTDCLGFPAPDEMINFISTLKEPQVIDEYFDTLLDPTIEQHRSFIFEFKKRICGKKNNNKNGEKKKSNRQSDVKQNIEQSKNVEIGGAKKKTKYVSLYDQNGQMNDVILLKGRHKCDCQASKHNLINNCMQCGRIVCEQEGSGSCLFCGNLVCTEDELRLISSSSKKGEHLKKSLQQLDRPNGWKEAVAMRNRLLEYDRTSERRTTVIDDEFDYFKSNSVWLSDAERKKLEKLEREMQEKKHSSRCTKKITIDFAGREIVEEPTLTPQFEQELLKQVAAIDSLKGNAHNYNFQNFGKIGDNDVHPLLEVAPPIFDDKFISNSNENNQDDRPKYDGVYNRVQDKELLEISDLKKCMSMHQPWASLLVAGIKKHEGRCWYSSHRGRLWIAATAKSADPEEIKIMENFYRRYYNNNNINFPKQYPSGCLIGCVLVQNVLPQEEYRRQYPEGESDSPFVFICSEPQELPVRFPITGSHKIYKLEDNIHIAAVKSLQRLAKLNAEDNKSSKE